MPPVASRKYSVPRRIPGTVARAVSVGIRLAFDSQDGVRLSNRALQVILNGTLSTSSAKFGSWLRPLEPLSGRRAARRYKNQWPTHSERGVAEPRRWLDYSERPSRKPQKVWPAGAGERSAQDIAMELFGSEKRGLFPAKLWFFLGRAQGD
jgi:hypothetical protein